MWTCALVVSITSRNRILAESFKQFVLSQEQSIAELRPKLNLPCIDQIRPLPTLTVCIPELFAGEVTFD